MNLRGPGSLVLGNGSKIWRSTAVTLYDPSACVIVSESTNC